MELKSDFLFYGPDIETSFILDPADSLHCTKVLRKKVGDVIQVTDGKGLWLQCLISDPNPKKCGVRILDKKMVALPKRKVGLAICPTKNADRIEYLVEKAVEIGVSEIFFIKSVHTYPKRVNVDRLTKIAVSAMKQSLKCYLPKISELIDLKNVNEISKSYSQLLLAHYDIDARPLTQISLTENVLILIGPEGDLNKEEIIMANNIGFETVTLGENRLRTETAGLVAISILNLL